MSKFSSCFLLTVGMAIASTLTTVAEPVINLNLLTPDVVCSSGNDTVRYSVNASGIPANTNIVIYQSNDINFNPYLGQGDSIGYISGNAIPQDTVNFGRCIKTAGIFIDACGATGLEGKNEYMILTSGSGIKVSNLAINYDLANSNSGDNNDNDINTGSSPCGFKTPNATLISNLQIGSCNASNIIPASPTDSIPPNAIILCFTSNNVTANYSVNGLCNLGYPIYVVQSSCTRTIGAFTNAASCSSTPTTRYRKTIAIDKRQNCQDNFVYDRCGLFDLDGTYAIRQTGTDTARVSNNGIRRNAIDSCGGIDYAQLNFTADTTLKFRISPNFCNDGYHYIKAITHPNGTQPISNTIQYKLVCNDVTAVSTTTNICSSELVNIDLSSTDTNATLSWTVSGGTSISGAVAGNGKNISQTLTYSGNTKDSVTYTATSTDAGCTKTQTIKVVVNNCITTCNPAITGNKPLCQGDSIQLSAGDGFTTYTWSTGQSSQTIFAKASGKYVVSVTGDNNCTGKDSVNVVVNPIPQVSINGNTAICVESETRLTATADVDSLRWNTGATTSTISVSQAQNYSVTVYRNGCSNSASVRVTQLDLPSAFSLGNDTTYCGSFSRILSAGNSTTQWNTDVTAAQITVTQAGTYIAVISNDCGSVSDTIVITQNEFPVLDLGKDTAFCNGELLLMAPGEMRSYLWSTGDQSSSITVTAEGTYSVKITDSNGCSATDSIHIINNCLNDIWIPNAFSPNGDGVNDVFMVRGNPRNITIEKMLIYNRWGNKVFEANNILPDDKTTGWNGTYKGADVQFEVYGYYVVVRFKDGSKQVLKGNVTLVK